MMEEHIKNKQQIVSSIQADLLQHHDVIYKDVKKFLYKAILPWFLETVLTAITILLFFLLPDIFSIFFKVFVWFFFLLCLFATIGQLSQLFLMKNKEKFTEKMANRLYDSLGKVKQQKNGNYLICTSAKRPFRFAINQLTITESHLSDYSFAYGPIDYRKQEKKFKPTSVGIIFISPQSDLLC